jgi:hypothetical protein
MNPAARWNPLGASGGRAGLVSVLSGSSCFYFSFPLWARLLLVVALGPTQLLAHTANESYLTLRVDGTNVTGQLDVARRDLQQGLTVGGADVSPLSVDERLRREEAYGLDLVARLVLQLDDRTVPLAVTDFTTLPLNNGEYARLLFAASGVDHAPATLRINCRALFGIDRSMHGLLRLEHGGRTDAVAYTVDTPLHEFTLGVPGSRWAQWRTFVAEGVWHIWIGFDHILFLVALLLPAVFREDRATGRWAGVERFRPALINVLKIVTAFTVAHSITLSLAALNIVTLPSRLVESAIAASVVLAATNNLYPWFRDKGWIVAFGFGLIHGFGFANVLGELGLTSATLARALIGFNIGVELGQLAIVAVFLPAAYALRELWFYRVIVFKAGSIAVILVATYWMFQRIFE